MKEENQNVAAPLAGQTKLQEPPDSGLPTQAPVDVPQEENGSRPQPINSADATPKPKHDSEISMEEESQSVDDYMKANDLSEKTLENSNEPQFKKALDSKREAQNKADAAPGEYRREEQTVLQNAQEGAQKDGKKGFGGMFNERSEAFTKVFDKQKNAEKSDKEKQEEVHKELERIYNDTKTEVNDILDKLSETVDEIFSGEVERANETFEENVEDELDEIYGFTVIDDWLFGEDTEAIEKVFRDEKQRFVSTMDLVLDKIAGLIARELNRAIARVKKGRTDAETFFKGLDEKQKSLATDAMDMFRDRFDELETTVREKEQELAEDLARSYQENIGALRKKFDTIKEEVAKGWIGKALDAIAAIIEIIKSLVVTLTDLLVAVIEAIGAIIQDPIGFLSNLFSGIKQGFGNFITNILQHLTSGILSWLTGSLGSLNIQMPEDIFSLKGIFSLVTQVLGLTWSYIREKAVKLLTEPVMNAIEKGVEIFEILQKDGILGVWEYIKEQFNDLKETVMDSIQEMLIAQIIDAGIKWILGLFSPAGAFIKAAMMIIDIVKFFLLKASQILELVQSFTESIRAVAQGGITAAASAIENALSKAIPVLIGFLASLLGISGLTQKVQKIIGKIKKRIDKAITKLIMKAKKMGKKILAKLGIGSDGKKDKEKGADGEKLEDSEVGKTVKFTADEKQHQMWVDTSGGVEIMIKSTPMSIGQKLDEWEGKVSGLEKEKQGKAKGLIGTARSQYKNALREGVEAKREMTQADNDKASEKDIQEAGKADQELESAEDVLKGTMKQLFEVFGEEGETELLAIKEEFSTESETHTLSITEEEDAKLMMASQPMSFHQFLDSIKNDTNAVDVEKARNVVSKFYKSRSRRIDDSKSKSDQQKERNQKRTELIDLLKNELWPLTTDLLKGKEEAHTGTSNDPIPVVWHKPHISNSSFYPPIKVEGYELSDGRWVDAPDVFTAGHLDEIYVPPDLDEGIINSENMPVGVGREFHVNEGTRLKRRKDLRSTLTRFYREVFKRHGNDLSGLQVDHVQDLNWGGEDVFQNLWPLDSSINQSAGFKNNQQIVMWIDGDQIKAIAAGDPHLDGKYFVVSKVESP